MNKTLRIGYIAFLIASLIGIGCSSILPGNDSLVVRAEQAEKDANVAFNAFVQVEYANRDALLKVNPQIQKLADKVRVGWTNWVQTLDRAILTYKGAKTPDNATALVAAQAVIEGNLAQTKAATQQSLTNLYPQLPLLKPIGN